MINTFRYKGEPFRLAKIRNKFFVNSKDYFKINRLTIDDKATLIVSILESGGLVRYNKELWISLKTLENTFDYKLTLIRFNYFVKRVCVPWMTKLEAFIKRETSQTKQTTTKKTRNI